MLRVGEVDKAVTDNQNQVANNVEACDGVDKINALQFHDNEDIYKKAYHLIDKVVQFLLIKSILTMKKRMRLV